MSQEGFEPTIIVLERAKTVRASDRAATVIGYLRTIRYLKRRGISLSVADYSKFGVFPQD
jgi:hypothetical protein